MRPGVLSYILIGINVIVFLIESSAGGTQKAAVAKRFGAMYSGMPRNEWWRYITSMFLHFGYMHLLCNMYALYNLGRGIEILFGRAGFLLIYFAAGIIGNLLTELVWQRSRKNSLSAGASGAVFGLMGAYLVAGLNGYLTSSGMQSILICIAINLAYGLSNRRINMTAHVGGFAGGLAIAFILLLF